MDAGDRPKRSALRIKDNERLRQMTHHDTLFSALSHYSEQSPSKTVYSFANDKGQIEQTLSWQELRLKVDALTGFLRSRCKLRVGDRVLLVYPPSLDFVLAFASCIRAGLIPVPVYPPNPLHADKGMAAFNKVAVDCDARLVVTNRAYARTRKLSVVQDFLSLKRSKWAIDLRWVTTDDVCAGDYAPVYGPEAAANDVALIQYTSGSTSTPKGVVITHGNLLHQIELSREGLGMNEHSRGVLWVPQYHDMGLIGGILNALGGNLELTLFSPLDFIKRPALWFELMHELRATHTAAPNFAYELALRKTSPEQRAQWDLSSLQVVMSAAEPVRASTSRRFLEAFAVAGLRPEAYLPAYGLAEHTVAVSFSGGTVCQIDKHELEVKRKVRVCDEAVRDSIELVSSGTWSQDVRLKIVDPETSTECEDDEVGEIWVDSPSKAAGYWKLDQDDVRSFSARLVGDEQHRYLRTGDLGFVRDGQLYICGRIKDMLILAGRNLYPQDVEDCVQLEDERLKPGGVACFSVEVESAEQVEEKLVLLAEVRNPRSSVAELRALAQKLQSAVLQSQQIACHAIVLAPVGSVLKTTSGKVRRQACRSRWLDGRLVDKALYVLQAKVAAPPQPQPQSISARRERSDGRGPLSQRETMMRDIAGQLLNLPNSEAVDVQVPLPHQGMGSLTAIEFCQEYEKQTQEELSIAQFFNKLSIRELSRSFAEGPQRQETLDEVRAQSPGGTIDELYALRRALLRERDCTSGFKLGSWAVRPARLEDVPVIHRLDQSEYGWLGEDATDDADFIRHQLEILNSGEIPWLWLLERTSARGDSEVVGWYIMQPTNKSPEEIRSWDDATDQGRLRSTFDPRGKQLYLVAAGIAREHSKQAHRLMVLNALSLMKETRMERVFACLAMPGFAEARASEDIRPEDYMRLELADGTPRDAFLAFFRELWVGTHRPFRLLRNGYPPDQHSGGHGVCACVDIGDHRRAIMSVFDKLTEQRFELFANASEPQDTVRPEPSCAPVRGTTAERTQVCANSLGHPALAARPTHNAHSLSARS